MGGNVEGTTISLRGQTSGCCDRNAGPVHHASSLTICCTAIPRDGRSAELLFPGTWCQRAGFEDCCISDIRLPTSTVKRRLRGRTQWITFIESVQYVTSSGQISTAELTYLPSRVPSTAPCNSRSGMDRRLMGAGQAFAIANVTTLSLASCILM